MSTLTLYYHIIALEDFKLQVLSENKNSNIVHIQIMGFKKQLIHPRNEKLDYTKFCSVYYAGYCLKKVEKEDSIISEKIELLFSKDPTQQSKAKSWLLANSKIKSPNDLWQKSISSLKDLSQPHSYKQMAQKLNISPRYFAKCISQNPLCIIYPCHLIVSTSCLSPTLKALTKAQLEMVNTGEYLYGAEVKKELIAWQLALN